MFEIKWDGTTNCLRKIQYKLNVLQAGEEPWFVCMNWRKTLLLVNTWKGDCVTVGRVGDKVIINPEYLKGE